MFFFLFFPIPPHVCAVLDCQLQFFKELMMSMKIIKLFQSLPNTLLQQNDDLEGMGSPGKRHETMTS